MLSQLLFEAARTKYPGITPKQFGKFSREVAAQMKPGERVSINEMSRRIDAKLKLEMPQNG